MLPHLLDYLTVCASVCISPEQNSILRVFMNVRWDVDCREASTNSTLLLQKTATPGQIAQNRSVLFIEFYIKDTNSHLLLQLLKAAEKSNSKSDARAIIILPVIQGVHCSSKSTSSPTHARTSKSVTNCNWHTYPNYSIFYISSHLIEFGSS